MFPLDLLATGSVAAARAVRIAGLGLSVPPGFVVAPAARSQPADLLRAQLGEALAPLERITGRTLGDARDPLAVAVRAAPSAVPAEAGIGDLSTVEALAAAMRALWERTEGDVVVQATVRGSADARSGSGIVFTRDPATGSPGVFGRFFPGWDADRLAEAGHGEPLSTLRGGMPEVFEALEQAVPRVEAACRDMCQIRFTVESGTLWILEVSPGRRNAAAAVRIAVDLVDEGLIEVDEGRDRVPLGALARLQWPVLAATQPLEILGRGKPQAPGVGTGRITFESPLGGPLPADAALVCAGPQPIDPGTAEHVAAIVTASSDGLGQLVLGPPAVWIDGLDVRPAEGTAVFPGGLAVSAGDRVAVDGSRGVVASGTPAFVPAQPGPRLARLLAWCDDSPVEVLTAIPEGAMTLTSLEAAADCAGRDVVVELGPDLDELCLAAITAGARSLLLSIPDRPLDSAPKPPAGPWSAVVAPPHRQWAGTLLASRLSLEFSPPPPIAPGDRRDGRS